MRVLKLCVAVGLVAAVAVPASAVHIVNGPLKMTLDAYDSGTNYAFAALPVPPPTGTGAELNGIGEIPPVGAFVGEDSFGVGEVDLIQTADIQIQPPPGPGWINGPGGDPIWVAGTPGGLADGTELVAVFWGHVDTEVVIAGTGDQNIYGRGMQFAAWVQPFGAADATTALIHGAGTDFADMGSIARGATGAIYDGVGVPGGVPGATLWLTGTATPGFFPGSLDPLAEFKSVFNPGAGAGGITGHTDLYLTVGPVDADGDGFIDDVGAMNQFFDTNFFLTPPGSALPGTRADLNVYIQTRGLNVGNVPGFGPPDWTVGTQSGVVTGIAVPEPVTVLGVLMGVAGLGGYLRRRRSA